MKMIEHVEHLLRQGRKPKELIELGFPKSVVTRVRRRLRQEKVALEGKVQEEMAQPESDSQSLAESPEQMAVIQQKLRSMETGLQKVDSLVKSLSEVAVLMAAARQIGTFRRETCPYEEDGLCTLVTWSSEDEVPQGMGELVLVEGEKPQWYIRPAPSYCAMCIASLENRIDDVENKVSGDPLSGAGHQFTCEGCGSKGWIAANIKCTKCGRETYLGWWPKKE